MTIHYGNPVFHPSPGFEKRARDIQLRTRVTSDGKLYWREEVYFPWRHLSGQREFVLFNSRIDAAVQYN